jgi:hypothetical protein
MTASPIVITTTSVRTPHADRADGGLEASPMRRLQSQRDQRQPHAGKEVPWRA